MLSIGITRCSTPSVLASAAASVRLCSDEYRVVIATVSTCTGPRASTARHAVSAELIDVEEIAAVLHRLLPNHLPAEVGFSEIERARGDVDEQARVLRRQLADRVAIVEAFRPEVPVVPDVFADGDPHASVVEGNR